MLFIVNAYTHTMQRARDDESLSTITTYTQSVTLSQSLMKSQLLSTIISCLRFVSPKMNPTGRTFGFSHPQDYLWMLQYIIWNSTHITIHIDLLFVDVDLLDTNKYSDSILDTLRLTHTHTDTDTITNETKNQIILLFVYARAGISGAGDLRAYHSRISWWHGQFEVIVSLL